VPLVLRYPRRIAATRVSRAFVELVDLAPTIYNLCGLPTPAPVQGRSLSELLAGRTTKHREHVIVEYAPNDEVMIRDGDWKLIYERGAQRRTDGYDIAGPLVPHQFRLYDLSADPEEMHNVAGPANAAIMARLAERLVEHLSVTARQVELVPRTADQLALLDYLVQSRDVASAGKRD
jgi:arylsulfatase A-like enzyme